MSKTHIPSVEKTVLGGPHQEITNQLLSKVTYITPNQTEATLLTGIEVQNEESAREVAKILIEKDVKAVDTTVVGDAF